MNETVSPISFLGLGDHVEYGTITFPFGPIDIFGLSVSKTYPFYPWPGKGLIWLFIVHESILRSEKEEEIFIEMKSKNDEQVGHFTIHTVKDADQPKTPVIPPTSEEIEREGGVMLPAVDLEWQFIPIQLDGSIKEPGDYYVYATYNNKVHTVGRVLFNYDKSEPLSNSEINAIKSDPTSSRSVRMWATCKHCLDSLKAYSGIEKDNKSEKEGYLWQHDLPDQFTCKCNKTTYNLKYLKESLHELLRNSLMTVKGGLSYTRKYSHSQIVKVTTQFNQLLEKEANENVVQKFIEKNLVILSSFNGKKIFIKPSILGKYETDFVVLTTTGELIFIELERPSMKLFKKDGHQTANLTHAYGQVVDWLEEFRKHSGAILEHLDITEDKIHKVKGAVIAGLSYKEETKHIQRHMMSGLHPNIDLYCLDDLSTVLVQLSKDLA